MPRPVTKAWRCRARVALCCAASAALRHDAYHLPPCDAPWANCARVGVATAVAPMTV